MLSLFVQNISADFGHWFERILFFSVRPSHLDGKQITRRLPTTAELTQILVQAFVPICLDRISATFCRDKPNYTHLLTPWHTLLAEKGLDLFSFGENSGFQRLLDRLLTERRRRYIFLRLCDFAQEAGNWWPQKEMKVKTSSFLGALSFTFKLLWLLQLWNEKTDSHLRIDGR